MLGEQALERALAAAGLSAPVRWDDVTESTNATALALAAEGAPSWTLVAASHQTAGRGRHGRVWRDRPGSALLCSLVLRPDWPPDRVGLVSLSAGAAMAEAISEIAGVEIRCKWPNDLMAGDTKIGGILGEAQVSAEAIVHVVVGIGVNIDVPEGVPGAGAIGNVDEEALLASFLRRCSSMIGASAH
ncbi:MAG TPA: biotin--[acetyl-CoA-carboxylase] ligase, partial [Actinomycetota bacterium]